MRVIVAMLGVALLAPTVSRAAEPAPPGARGTLYAHFRWVMPDQMDYRPRLFPPPGPYWIIGRTQAGDAMLEGTFPRPTRPDQIDLWPGAVNIKGEPRERIVFDSEYPCPDWWQPRCRDDWEGPCERPDYVCEWR